MTQILFRMGILIKVRKGQYQQNKWMVIKFNHGVLQHNQEEQEAPANYIMEKPMSCLVYGLKVQWMQSGYFLMRTRAPWVFHKISWLKFVHTIDWNSSMLFRDYRHYSKLSSMTNRLQLYHKKTLMLILIMWSSKLRNRKAKLNLLLKVLILGLE